MSDEQHLEISFIDTECPHKKKVMSESKPFVYLRLDDVEKDTFSTYLEELDVDIDELKEELHARMDPNNVSPKNKELYKVQRYAKEWLWSKLKLVIEVDVDEWRYKQIVSSKQ